MATLLSSQIIIVTGFCLLAVYELISFAQNARSATPSRTPTATAARKRISNVTRNLIFSVLIFSGLIWLISGFATGGPDEISIRLPFFPDDAIVRMYLRIAISIVFCLLAAYELICFVKNAISGTPVCPPTAATVRKRIFNITRDFIFLALILPGLTLIFGAGDPRKIPIELPFYPDKVGDIYTFDVNVVEPMEYLVAVRFYLILPNKWSRFFDKKWDSQESKRFDEILGVEFVNQWIDHGVPAKFRIQIIKKVNDKIILDELVDHPGTRGSTYGTFFPGIMTMARNEKGYKLSS
jgi:hypothetical protein